MQRTTPLYLLVGTVLFLVLASFKPDPPVPQRMPRWVVEHDTLLAIEDEFGLRPEYPTIFTFQLEEGDSIFFECPSFAYLIEKRQVRFTWITPTNSLQIGPALIEQGITAEFAGEYRLEIQAKKRLSLNQKAFERIEDFVIHRFRANRKDPYQPETFLQASNVYIGDEADGGNVSNPVFRLFVGKEDSLSFLFSPVEQASVENLILQVQTEGGGAPVPFYVDATGVVNLPRSRSVQSGYILIQLKTNSNQPFYKQDQDFYNVSAVRVPKPLLQTSSGQIVIGGAEEAQAVEEEGQPKSATEILIEEFLKNQNQTFEDIERVGGQGFSITVPGRMQLNGKNRICRPLDMVPANILVYWVGVGHGALDEYKAINTYQQSINANPRDVGDIMTRYARSALIRNAPKNSLFRGETESMAFDEYIEYTILDEANKNAFLEGRSFSSVMVNQDHGFQLEVPDVPLYLCLCNQNRVSEVEVTFNYSLFNRFVE